MSGFSMVLLAIGLGWGAWSIHGRVAEEHTFPILFHKDRVEISARVHQVGQICKHRVTLRRGAYISFEGLGGHDGFPICGLDDRIFDDLAPGGTLTLHGFRSPLGFHYDKVSR